jgi:hypothetical protein
MMRVASGEGVGVEGAESVAIDVEDEGVGVEETQ